MSFVAAPPRLFPRGREPLNPESRLTVPDDKKRGGRRSISPASRLKSLHEIKRGSGIDYTNLASTGRGLVVKADEELARLLVTINPTQHDEEVDVVISGGGLRGYYAAGVFDTLRKVPGLRIRRVAGASAGAWCAVFYQCGVTTSEWTDTFRRTQQLVASGCTILEAYDRIRDVFPKDAHIKCTNKVFISITKVSLSGGIENLIVSQFDTQFDVFEACIASSNVPFAVSNGFGRKFQGHRVLDGAVLNNAPLFPNNDRRQILVNLGNVAYPGLLSLMPADACIESLVVRGALESRRFLDGVGEGNPLEWIHAHAKITKFNAVEWRLQSALYWTSLVILSLPALLLVKILRMTSRSFKSATNLCGRSKIVWSRPSKIIMTSSFLVWLYSLSFSSRALVICLVATGLLTRFHQNSSKLVHD